MREKNIVVPDGMLKAALEAASRRIGGKHTWIGRTCIWCGCIIESLKGGMDCEGISFISAEPFLSAALLWLSEHPIVPTDMQMSECGACEEMRFADAAEIVVRFQKEFMFLAPEEEVPEAIKDLLEPQFTNAVQAVTGESNHNRCVLEAYRRGQRNPK